MHLRWVYEGIIIYFVSVRFRHLSIISSVFELLISEDDTKMNIYLCVSVYVKPSIYLWTVVSGMIQLINKLITKS